MRITATHHTTPWEDQMDPVLDGVIEVIVHVLGIEERADELDATTVLFGGIPELDSLAVLELVTSLEERFGIVVEDDDVTGEVFETIGTLTDFVAERSGASA